MINAVIKPRNSSMVKLTLIGFFAFAPLLTGCSLKQDIAGFNLVSTDYDRSQPYPTLQPLAFFNVAHSQPVNAGNLIARAAELRRKVIALTAPVISGVDRSRLEAAIARNAARR